MRHLNQKPGTRRRQAGSTLLEGAFVVMTIVSMIIFIMDFGRMLLMQQFITERARTTARAAAVNNWDSDAVANYFCYNNTTAPSDDTVTAGYMGLVPSEVTYQSLGSAGAADYRLQVVVSGVPMLTWVPFISGRYTAPPITVTFPAQSLGATN